MPGPWIRRLVPACLLAFAACSGDVPSAPPVTEDALIARETGVRLVLVSGGGQTGMPGRPLAEPIVVRVLDQEGAPVANGLVNFLAAGGSAAEPRQTRTDADGYARATWTLGTSGEQTLRVAGSGGTLLLVTAIGQPGTGATLALVKTLGDGQSGAPGEPLRQVVQVRLLRDDGTPVAGAPIAWTVATGGGSVAQAAGRTSATGYAMVRWTLGSTPGEQTVVAATPGAEPVTFTATARTTVLLLSSGDNQAGAAGTVLPRPLLVRALRADGTPVSGAVITWSATTGGGTLDRASTRTSSTGYAKVTWTLGPIPGVQTVTASLGGTAPVVFTAMAGQAPPHPAVLRLEPDSLVLDVGQTGRFTAVLLDQHGVPLPGPAPEWSSSNPAVATVDAEGNVTGVASGNAQVTARVGVLAAHATVRVRAPAVAVAVPLIQKRVASTGGAIDVSTRDVTLNFWVHLSARASTISMRVRNPAGGTENCLNVDAENYFYNEFRCQVYLSRGAPAGVWRVDQVTVTRDGSTRTYTAADLDAMGTEGRAFDVHGAGADTSPPQIRVVWPRGQDSYDAGFFYVQIGVVDHVTGTHSVSATVRGPGGQTASCSAHSGSGALAKIGDWYCRLPMPVGSGRWHLVSITTLDGAGNSATYTPQQIDASVRGVWELTFLQYGYDR